MAYATWKSSLETGDTLVDSEHKEIFSLVNELHDAIVQRRERAAQDEILASITVTAREHFVHEEALMRSIHYPGLLEQKKLHKAFLAETKRLSAEYECGEARLPITLAMFLHEWLVTHMRVEDRKIGEFIRERAANG